MLDMKRAQNEGFIFAAKVVRGAYMVQERNRARDLGYEDPIFPNIQATHSNYHLCVDEMLKKIQQCNVMIASHNEDSVQFVLQKMKEYEINSSEGRVYFGQLLGMCDYITFGLGRKGYGVFKYVPYGSVHQVVPYLIRRTEENSAILGSLGVKKERLLLWTEFKRRLFSTKH